ncbi:hypothetical protein PI124_g1227 [Phytophthora idaei]|nr:hypothetical protein PI125_g7862 [Phytophthora idaei]KAG3146030.1 hypothetical protein PI126_g13494 [Phytophthora idaei]KAG3254223.1 hypothetical protein PI124_g1227 [Phytophthora idaei]
MSGRSQTSSHPEAPHGQRHSPHTAPQEHPPTSTLLLRGLARSVDDEMILRALQSFRPLQARTIYDKATGEPRGFAFVDFDSVESAMQAMNAFESRPLVLQHRDVNVSYTDGFRRRSPEDSNRPQDQRQGERWQPRPDWICDECNVINFARRTNCFQCKVSKTAQTKEIPVTAAFRQDQLRSRNDSHYGGESGASSKDDVGTHRRGTGGENTRNVPPSQVLVVRMLPPGIEEGELHVAFAEFDGVQDIRLIRDRATNLSRGFGFVEFRDIEAATNALHKCAGLVVQNTHVEVSYARDTLTTRSQYVADLHPGPRTGSSMVVTALEQAQWSLSQGRGADATTDQQNSVDQDVNALLEGAAAAVVPRFEEPKKMWPPPFESAGGSYMYVSEYGLYWDPDSLFYYDAHTMVYHNSFTGAYYRCVAPESSGASAFQLFVPPLPVDDEVYNETTTATIPAASKPALSLSLKKDKKKAAGISFAIKTTAFASAASVSETNSQVKAAGSGVVPPAASAVSVTSIGIKRKSADDIAKWSQRQREAKQHEAGNTSTAPTQQANNSSEQKAVRSATSVADSVIDALTNVPQEAPICLLCRRKFGSLEMLRKHEKLSKLHLANLAKANKNKQHIAAQYREHEKEMERDAKKQRQEVYPPSVPSNNWSAPTPGSSSNPESTASSLESGFGGKMLKLMGWKSGEGLGKHGSGITAPINAAGQGGRSDTAGLGSKAPLSASVDLSDVTSDKERRQRLAHARYDTA